MAFDRYDPENPTILFYGQNLLVLAIDWPNKIVQVGGSSFIKYFPSKLPTLVAGYNPTCFDYPITVRIQCQDVEITSVLSVEDAEIYLGDEWVRKLMGGEKLEATASS